MERQLDEQEKRWNINIFKATSSDLRQQFHFPPLDIK